LVRGERDRAGEARRHGVAVSLDVMRVAMQQPQAHGQTCAEREHEEKAEEVRGVHRGSFGDAGSGQEL